MVSDMIRQIGSITAAMNDKLMLDLQVSLRQ
jgi:hypothetical protein